MELVADDKQLLEFSPQRTNYFRGEELKMLDTTKKSKFVAPGDEKIILEERRRELMKLNLLVFRIVIAVERLNYYTMGFIMPRTQNLEVVEFGSTNPQVYNLQTCMQVQSVIKLQIERQEQIEKQLLQSSSTVRAAEAGLRKQMTSYFETLTTEQ
jgi:hypothetical protein